MHHHVGYSMPSSSTVYENALFIVSRLQRETEQMLTRSNCMYSMPFYPGSHKRIGQISHGPGPHGFRVFSAALNLVCSFSGE